MCGFQYVKFNDEKLTIAKFQFKYQHNKNKNFLLSRDWLIFETAAA